MSAFEFKLNVYDQAASSDSPFNAGYLAARQSLVSHVAELQQQLEAARKDAERYRWLRAREPGAAWRIEGVIYSSGGAYVDAQIDAAIDCAEEIRAIKVPT